MEQRDLINKKYEPVVVWQSTVLGYMLIVFFFLAIIFLSYFSVWSDKSLSEEYYNAIVNDFIRATKIFSYLITIIFLIHLGLKAGPVLNTYFVCNDSEIIYRKNFISLVQIRVKYTDIKEVILSQGIIQKKMKIGTVRAITQANIGDAGIALFDVKEYQEIYDFLIEKTKENKLK